jgi:hypothetical protein
MQHKRLIIGLTVLGFFIVLFLGGWLYLTTQPPSNLGTKQELVSQLTEYFGRESEIGVKIVNETTYDDAGPVYRYDLIASSDSQRHGFMEIRTFDRDIWKDKVWMVFLAWTHNGDEKLVESGYLMLSGLADITIQDWRKDDGQPNRNVEMLSLVTNNPNYENWDLTERGWRSSVDNEKIAVVVDQGMD